MLALALAATLALRPALPREASAQGLGTTQASAPKPRLFSPDLTGRTRPVATAPAIYGNWRSCQIGGGGTIGRVAFTADPRILYAHAELGGIYRSEDGGRRWRMVHGTLFARAESVADRTAPGVARLGAPAVRDLSVDPANPDRVLVLVGDGTATPQGLFETRDGGRTWRRLLAVRAYGNGPLRWTGGLIARDPRDPRTILVGSAGDGVYRSADDGKTWRQIGAGLAEPNGVLRDAYLTDLRFDRSDSRRVWATAGRTRAYRVEAGRDVAYRGGWFFSDDSGRTWTRRSDVGPTEFVQDGGRPERLIGLFDSLFVRVSDDRGRTWRDYDEGLVVTRDPDREPYVSDSRFDALVSGPGFQLLATARGTLYRRNTNETAWQQVLPEGTTQRYEGRPWIGEDGLRASDLRENRRPHPPRFGTSVGSLAIDPRDPAHLWLTDLTGAYESRDGGENWDLSIDGIETGLIRVLESDPAAPGLVHLGMAEFGVLLSRDGATSFESSRTNATMTSISAARLLADRTLAPATVASRTNLGSAGARQESIRNATFPTRIDRTISDDEGVSLIASGDSGESDPRDTDAGARVPLSNTVWLSADRGGSWTRSPMTGLPNREAHWIHSVIWDPSRANRAYAAVGGVGGGVFVSTDGGLSWLRDSQGLPDRGDLFPADPWTIGRELALDGDGNLLVASGSRGELYRRAAGGFIRISGKADAIERGIEGVPNEVAGAEVRGGAFFVATDRGVYRSEDAGRTWTRTLPRAARYVAVDRTNPRRVAAGCDGAILLSEDGGLRWREVDSALPDRNFPRVGFAAGRLLAGTTGSGAFWLPLDSSAYLVAATRPLPRRSVEIPVARPGSLGRPLELLPDAGFEDLRRFDALWTIGFTGRGRLGLESAGGTPAAGARSLRLRAATENSAGSASARLESPPRRFRVSGAARSAGLTTEALIGIQTFDRDARSTGLIVLFDARNADKWRRFSSDVELPAGTETANLVVTYAGSGSVSLDDVAFETVVEGVTDPERPLPEDLLANGGFEDAAPIATDWTVGYQSRGELQISATPVNPHSGERALQVRNAGSNPVEGAAAYRLRRLPRRFRFEGWARVDGTPGTALIAVQAFDRDGRQTTYTVAIDARTANSWRSFSTEIELPDDAVDAYVVAVLKGTGTLLLDDLRLTTLLDRR